MCERHLISCLNWGSEPETFWCMGQCSKPTEPPSQSIIWFIFKPFPHNSDVYYWQKEKKSAVSLLIWNSFHYSALIATLFLFFLLQSFWPSFQSLPFLQCMGPLPIALSLPLVSPGSDVLTFHSLLPSLCTCSQASHFYISALDWMKAEAQCQCQMCRDLPVAVFCCFLSWTVAFFNHLCRISEILPPLWISSLASSILAIRYRQSKSWF